LRNDFGNHLIYYIITRNGFEILKGFCIFLLGNKIEKGRVERPIHISFSPRFSYHEEHIIFQQIIEGFEELNNESVRPRLFPFCIVEREKVSSDSCTSSS
jgi:hypothetical protein